MKKFTQIIFTLILLLSVNIFANAQTKWTQIKTQNEELKISIPNNFTFFLDEEGKTIPKLINGRYSKENIRLKNLRSITAYENGLVVWLESYDVMNGKEAFPYYLPDYSNNSSDDVSDYKIGDYSLRSITKEKEHYVQYVYFHSDKKLYTLGIGARDKNNPLITKFLQSAEFNGKNLFTSKIEQQNTKAETGLVLEQLKTTPLEVIASENAEKLKNAAKNESEEQIGKDDLLSQITDKSNQKSLVILTKPSPAYTDKARRSNTQGTIVLRLIFGRDGHIRKINVVKSLDYGLVEKTIEAARRIRFLPQETDGKPQEVIKTIQYNFTIY